MKKIVVLNYGLGNVRSVSNALRAIGANAEVVHDESSVMQADGLVIPGVGAFPHGMDNLKKSGLVELIKKYIGTGRPVLGICLGMQMLFNKGTEFVPTDGLGLIHGSVNIISILPEEGRLPHIAWSRVSPTELGRNGMFAGLTDSEMRFYFVHSYAAAGVKPDNLSATVNYLGHDIVAAVQRGKLWGTQFHPEKSGPSGLHLLNNFISIC
ncbi:imidazole glycerol phosphate synthase subunit HisH [Polynucleobacter sp. MWH-HuK1]|uniref:imidazole glycerol phosphate synthase subunit HisH n=1 Tax=Polynucleobacter sp. MWH-HuK1 TaxID=1743158 RepID=UPI001C0CA8C4|nr:imidazole glycerol phosphate synthase subunit HisH [Polynucleobacter sp. MWH-HuK1]MBU3564447.1 imidazole glycerol phosphate synthase subunit HisH [Polynucleobacter sp. MWH-HuK1]